jgi:hypothetical protein
VICAAQSEPPAILSERTIKTCPARKSSESSCHMPEFYGSWRSPTNQWQCKGVERSLSVRCNYKNKLLVLIKLRDIDNFRSDS